MSQSISWPPLLSLPAGSTTGAGSVLDNVSAKADHTIVCVGSSGISAGAVQIQGSMDGVNWFNMGSPVTATASTTTAGTVADFPVQMIRANVSTTITGGTVTVYVASA